MDQARTGQQEAPQSSYLTQTDDVFSLYLSQYDTLFSNAREASERKITEIYNRKSKSRAANTARTGERMLNSWPRSLSSDITGTLKDFFSMLGLTVDRVDPVGQDRHYKVTFIL